MAKEITVHSVLNKQKRRDDWFLCDYSMNPYEGCQFNCVYCYVHGSKYGEKMAEGIAVKWNAPTILDRQLKARAEKKEYGIIAVGSATDPYMPIEEERQITRRCLEVILKRKFPIGVTTRSPLILRDLDILREIGKSAILPEDLKEKGIPGVIISSSFSTVDEQVAKIFEPGAPRPLARMEFLKKCKDAGFMVGANFMPLLPYISDTEESLDSMVRMAKEHGLDFTFVSGLTLYGDGPADCKTKYYKALEANFPELVEKTRALFAGNFAPPGNYQGKLDEMARRMCEKYGMRYHILPAGRKS
ncbi:MAG: radical SAM protein [Candidatus Thermoplasmatota archaeon]|nr:radical SAM protein [Candidatus Thermoplasmatota archaeon]